MDVIEYVLNLRNVDIKLKHTADAATHPMPSSACGLSSPATSLEDAVCDASGLGSFERSVVVGSSGLLSFGLILSWSGSVRSSEQRKNGNDGRQQVQIV